MSVIRDFNVFLIYLYLEENALILTYQGKEVISDLLLDVLIT